MDKMLMGPQRLIYPMAVLVIGTKVDGKPNFMTAVWGGIANGEPPMISVAIRHRRHTHKGILQNLSFSVNLPSADLVREADYCGSVTGAKVDKAQVCQFKIFYGKIDGAPLIEQFPINLECSVAHILDLGSHSLVVGRIEETHVSSSCLTDGQPDIHKINPIVYISDPFRQYTSFGGKVIGKAYSIGQELRRHNLRL